MRSVLQSVRLTDGGCIDIQEVAAVVRGKRGRFDVIGVCGAVLIRGIPKDDRDNIEKAMVWKRGLLDHITYIPAPAVAPGPRPRRAIE